MPRMIEKRGVPRVPTDIFVQEVDGDRRFLHPALNISIDGISCYMDGSIHIDRTAQLEFTLPNSNKVISVRGRVAWVEEHSAVVYGVGFKFLDLDDEDQSIIKQYVDSLLASGTQSYASIG